MGDLLSSSQNHRSQFSIIAEILDLACAREGVLKTHIRGGAGLNGVQLNDYLSLLLGRNLLSSWETGRMREKSIYKTTDKGLRYLQHYMEIEELWKKPRVPIDLREGEEIVLTYTSAADKMKFFSAFIRAGLESGDAVWYTYPDVERETVRTKLKEQGVDVEKSERDGALHVTSLTADFKSNGKLDLKKSVDEGLKWWAEAKKKGYKHARGIEDYGDFSFVDGQLRRFIEEYWLDPRWDDPKVSEWVLPGAEEQLGVVMDPFVMDISAFNMERLTEEQVAEILQGLTQGRMVPTFAFIDLIEFRDSFSRLIGLDHEQLIGRKILLEFDPNSEYEKAIDSLAEEAVANVEPMFAFTSSMSIVYSCLTKYPSVNFFLLSTSTSKSKLESENEVILSARNLSQILDALNEALEKFVGINVFLVFDKISEIINLLGFENAYEFLRSILDMLPQTKATAIFLLNKKAHGPQALSRIRGPFRNILTYDKGGLKLGGAQLFRSLVSLSREFPE